VCSEARQGVIWYLMDSKRVLEHERLIKEDLIDQNDFALIVYAIVVLSSLPTFCIAWYFGAVKSLAVIMALMFLFFLMVLGEEDKRQLVEALVRPNLEEGTDKSMQALRLEMFKGVRGSVLDLSPGSGLALFRYYTGPKTKVKSIETFEPSSFMNSATKARAKFLKEKYGIETNVNTDASLDDFTLPENHKDKKYDWIVVYGFLSRVKNLSEQLDRLDSLLAPRGTILFMETNSPGTGTGGIIAKFINFVFYRLTGSNCNRNIGALMSTRVQWDVKCYKLRTFELFPASCMIAGYAKKLSK